MPSYTLRQFPTPVVSFGQIGNNDTDKLLKGVTLIIKLGASVAGKFSPALKAITVLLGEADNLSKKLKNLEEKIFDTILEGKIQALYRHVENLNDSKTSQAQKLAELVSAMSLLDEVLPLFSTDKSIYRERYYHGAPLFVTFCAILKGFCLVAQNIPDFNISSLQNRKIDYQNMLDWFRNRCIGSRMASCLVESHSRVMGQPQYGVERDWDRHYKKYNLYYREDKWIELIFGSGAYIKHLGGKGWTFWSDNRGEHRTLTDRWDTRSYGEVKFGTVEIPDSTKSHPKGREVLAEYRRRVQIVMVEFFNSFNLT